MELVALILLMLTSVGCLLKLGFYPWRVRLALALLLGVWAWFITPVVTEQPVSQLAVAVLSRETVLDVSALIVVEAILMIAWCFSTMRDTAVWTDPRWNKAVRAVLYCYPGLSLFGVAYVAVVWALLAFPGVDFRLLAWTVAVVSTALAALLSGALLRLLPQGDRRTELLFYTEYAAVLTTVVMVGMA